MVRLGRHVLLSTKEVAAALGVAVLTVHRNTKAGAIRPIAPGAGYYTRTEVERFGRKRKRKPGIVLNLPD